MSVNIKWYSFQHLYPPPTITCHFPPDILDSISRKSNRLRLKFVTKVNGKDVLWRVFIHADETLDIFPYLSSPNDINLSK